MATQHTYCEIGGDLFSKPNALCDIVESEAGKAAIVFCNMPSDTDLVKVILKKRGINSKKLIGNVPPEMTAQMMTELKSGQFEVIVATDIGARTLDMTQFGIVVHYSIAGDAEMYLNRAGTTTGKVVSMVGPLDIASFHQIRKALDFEIEKQELPSKESLALAKLTGWADKAAKMGVLADERFRELVPAIAAHPRRDELIAYLLFNLLEGAKTVEAPAVFEDRRSDDRGDDRRGRDRDRRGGRDRRDDRGRDGGMDSRDDRRGDNEGDGNDDGRESRNDNRDDRRNDRRDDRRNDRRDDYDDQPSIPQVRDARLYLGHGTRTGFTEETFKSLLGNTGAETDIAVKRFLSRDMYSYVDVSEEAAESVVTKLADATLADGTKLFLKKTISISEQRPGNARGGERFNNPPVNAGEQQPAAPEGEAEENVIV